MALEAAYMAGDFPAIGDQLQTLRIDAQADHPVRQFIGYAVAIALKMDQRSTGDGWTRSGSGQWPEHQPSAAVKAGTA